MTFGQQNSRNCCCAYVIPRSQDTIAAAAAAAVAAVVVVGRFNALSVFHSATERAPDQSFACVCAWTDGRMDGALHCVLGQQQQTDGRTDDPANHTERVCYVVKMS
jgi:hypothetical protein